MPKSRDHTVLLRVKFDKPVGIREAAAQVRDNVHGVFHLAQFQDRDPGEFKVKSVSIPPARIR